MGDQRQFQTHPKGPVTTRLTFVHEVGCIRYFLA
jgi:hypothetical protein